MYTTGDTPAEEEIRLLLVNKSVLFVCFDETIEDRAENGVVV